MLDIKFIRENSELIREAARKKHIVFDVSKLLEADDLRLKILKEVEEIVPGKMRYQRQYRQNSKCGRKAKSDC